MTFPIKKHWPLLLIIIAGTALRFYDLPRGDPISDEVLYGFRAIGYLDFDFAIEQPSPVQLFTGAIPWWTKLSFHDHPPLVFLVQHGAMKLMGANLWGLRFSSALFGLLSLYLVFLIGNTLFSKTAGVIAAALVASNIFMLYVSRVAIQESQVIFFMLLTVYLFLKACEPKVTTGAVRRGGLHLLWGASFGLAMLSKYTAFFLIIPFAWHLIAYHRAVFRQWYLYAGAVISVLVFSPVIIYNFFLYRTFGHFDFQLFYVFGQKVSYWQATPGKEIGSLADRLITIPVNLWVYGSPLFAVLLAAALVSTGWYFWKRRKDRQESLWFLLSLFLTNLAWYLFIGPAPRFLTMLIPWAALLIAFSATVLGRQMQRTRTILTAALALAIVSEAAFSINTTFAFQPRGIENLTYSKIHWDMHAWGYNVLDAYLGELTRGKYPSLSIPYTLQFLEDIKAAALQRAKEYGKQPAAILIAYTTDMNDLAALWIFNRRSLYEAWPMISADTYLDITKNEGNNFFSRSGFSDFYFIQSTENVLGNRSHRITEAGRELERLMQERGLEPILLKNHQGKDAFRIYHMKFVDKSSKI